MNDITFIIFGATGDLARRKLIPALYRLLAQRKIGSFCIIGAAIEDITADAVLEKAKQFIDAYDEVIWQQLKRRFVYQQLNFEHQDDFHRLYKTVQRVEKEYAISGNRLAYCAAASRFFCLITEYLSQAKIIIKKSDHEQPWHRIVYEKPFGHNAQSAREINECIKHYVDESQIYRIDHFLTKELVSNIALVRFTNCVFEPLWNNRYIDHVQISISERIGLEGRGGYYDHYGALSDVVQNHLLELMALIAMESPEKLSGNFVRDKRAAVLKDIQVIDGILGQYEGYRTEPLVNPQSQTETFAALYLRINNPRWAGVPFYIKTGKCLDKKETVINIKFKQVDCLLAYSCPVPSNWLKIEVTPEATFSLSLNAKKPGSNDEVVPVVMEFCHSCLFGDATPRSYEVVLEEVARGEQSISVRFDEIEYAWKVIDTVQSKEFPLYYYPCGSQGPREVETLFEQKHGMRWRS